MLILKNQTVGLPMILNDRSHIKFNNESVIFVFRDNSHFYLNLHADDKMVNATNITMTHEQPEDFTILGRVCIDQTFNDYIGKRAGKVRVVAPNLLSKLKIHNIMGLTAG